MSLITTTRFAPSPTGRLHIGHAYSALFAYEEAQKAGGRFILRIEDIDIGRARPEFEHGIYEDLTWLGLTWEEPVRRQSEHFDDYEQALNTLDQKGLLYPCFCTRKDITEEIEASGVAPHGPEGQLYPGTCRHLSRTEREERLADGTPFALRLNMDEAIAQVKTAGNWPLAWRDMTAGEQIAAPETLGDVVLGRKDVKTSYHLSVTLDDHIQGVTHVTRGKDLFYASHLHRLLQELLGLHVPDWHHHKLLTNRDGKRFAKRDKSVTLQQLREAGHTPEDIKTMIRENLKKAALTLCLTASLAITALSSPVQAEEKTPPLPPQASVEEGITKQVGSTPEKHFVTLSIENDNFASGNDRNYTNGLRLSYYKVNAHIPDFLKFIDPFLPGINFNNTTTAFWSVGQNMYTPQDITLRDPPRDDRPYAGWLYGSVGLVTATNDHIDEAEITLGIVGPASLARQAQETVHDLVNSDDPSGWDHQLKNEPGLNISGRRRWPRFAHANLFGLRGTLEPSIGATLGNVYTYASTGLFARITPMKYRWQDMPSRVRPAMPGTGYFGTPDDRLSWSLFAGAEGRAIARNIFLDGNTFADSRSVDKEHFVADLTAGASVSWQDFRLSYSATYRTREFKGQDDTDLFGAVTLTYRY